MRLSLRQALMAAGLAIVLGLAWLNPLDSSASEHAEIGLKRALTSFAAARALNAVISVVQGTEVSVQLAGFGPTFTPGQVLDPINDLVEQFSTLMLYASVAFGVQLVLIKIGGHWAVSLLLSAVAIAWVWLSWRQTTRHAWLTRLLAGVLLVRYAMPLVVLGSEAGFQVFLADRYKADQDRIELSTGRLTSLSTPEVAPKEGEGLSDRFKRWLSQGADVVREVGRRFDELKQVAEEMVRNIVMLIVVFLLQTLVLPMLLLWSLLRLGHMLAVTRA